MLISSTAILVNCSVASKARTELTSSIYVIELEFELSRMQMKQPSTKLKLNDNMNLRCGLRTLFYEPVHVNKRSEAC